MTHSVFRAALALGGTLVAGLAAIGAADATMLTAPNASAFFDFREVQRVDAAHVRVTLVLRLQNHGSVGITGGKVTLRERSTAAPRLGSYPGLVTLPAHGTTTLSASFVIPATLLKQWQTGAHPDVRLVYPDAAGRSIPATLQLVRLPGVGG